jgi:Zn-dependent peptidase ImmA (M78 family)
MYRQIFALEKKLHGFNKKPFLFGDFRSMCEQENIRFYFWDFPPEIKGVFFNDNFPVIGLNAKLTSPEKEIVAFQELGHYYLEHPNSFSLERLTFLLPRIEYEAKIFAALCLIPTPVLEKEKDEALSKFPPEFRCFRIHVYKNFLLKHLRTMDIGKP